MRISVIGYPRMGSVWWVRFCDGSIWSGCL